MPQDAAASRGSWTDPDPSRVRWLWALALPLLAWVALHPRGVAVEVASKSWRREVDIERLTNEMFSEPCDRMPGQAELKARREVDGVAHCRFVAPAWRKGRMAVAEGEAPAPPAWPAVDLQPGERRGTTRAWQELHLRDENDRRWSCRVPLAHWQGWPVAARTRLAVHRFSGVADCSSLPAPPTAPS